MFDVESHLRARTIERDLELRQAKLRRAAASKPAVLKIELVDRHRGRRLRRLAGEAQRVLPVGPLVVATVNGSPVIALGLDDGEIVSSGSGAARELVWAVVAAASWLGGRAMPHTASHPGG